MDMPKKDAIYWKVLNAAVQLEIQKGHQKWSITQLSKKSGVSRTLIYYYFGSSKIDLLRDAIVTIGQELAGISPARIELWKEGKIAESFFATRKILSENPGLLYFYLYNRNLENELGKTIRSREKSFRQKIAKFYPEHDSVTHDSIFALFFGVAWVDQVSTEAVYRSLEIIHKGLK